MTRPTLGIIIPTAGQGEIGFVAQTILQQELIEGDEVLVIGDGEQKEVEAQIEAFGPPFRYIQGPHTRDWGHSQVNLGLELIKSDYITPQDDDDAYLPRAFEVVRDVLQNYAAPRLTLFRFFTNDRHLVWRASDAGRIDETLIGSHNLVVPNRVGYRGEKGWTSRYRGDYDWVVKVLDCYARREWNWRTEILTRQRPDMTLQWWAVRDEKQMKEFKQLAVACASELTIRQAASASRIELGQSETWPFLFSVRGTQPFEYVGFALLERSPAGMTAFFGVSPKHQGAGYGRKILQITSDATMGDAGGESVVKLLDVYKEMGWVELGSSEGVAKLWRPYPVN